MLVGWEYRGVAAVGTVLFALIAGVVASFLTNRLTILAGEEMSLYTIALIGGIVGIVLIPLYTPRSRSVATLIERTGRRIAIACLVLIGLSASGIAAAPGLSTSLLVGGLLTLTLPAWYWVCRRQASLQRVLVVGDDSVLIRSAIQSLPGTPLGFLSPSLSEQSVEITHSREAVTDSETDDRKTTVATDGGVATENWINSIAGTDRLSGLSRLDHVIKERNIDTIALAFSQGDREEFFGVLRTCREHGVDALIHESLADEVLASERVGDALVRVNLEPWPWYSRVAKRAFDLAFAMVAMFMTAPLIIVIAVAIKLDSQGPILYNQTRSTILGEKFTVPKFRSMVTDAEANGAKLSEEDAGGIDPRVTNVGRILRKTHLDEIPQLFPILTGKMSVVGPRPERPELDREIEADGIDWSKRWFVKPGLTGIAQVNEVTGFEPGKKLAYDLEYTHRQSFWLDVKLVALQLWSVAKDILSLVSNRLSSVVDEKETRSK